jgi:hypothetical protein
MRKSAARGDLAAPLLSLENTAQSGPRAGSTCPTTAICSICFTIGRRTRKRAAKSWSRRRRVYLERKDRTQNDRMLSTRPATRTSWRSRRAGFRDHVSKMRSGNNGANAGRRLSDRLRMRRVRRHLAAEAGGLLRILLLRVGCVSADPGRATSRRLSNDRRLATYPTRAQPSGVRRSCGRKRLL